MTKLQFHEIAKEHEIGPIDEYNNSFSNKDEQELLTADVYDVSVGKIKQFIIAARWEIWEKHEGMMDSGRHFYKAETKAEAREIAKAYVDTREIDE